MTNQRLIKELKQLEEHNMLTIDKVEKNSDIFAKFSEQCISFDKYALAYNIVDEEEILGVIVLNRISQMNEYKLGKLYIEVYNNSVYSSLNNAFDVLLSDFINKEFYLKITTDVKINDTFKRDFLKNHSFVINKENETSIEYKITKPIYIERRK